MEGLFEALNGPVGGGDFSAESTLLVLLLAFVLGQVIAWTYAWTHSGLSYSRSFTQSLVLMTLVADSVQTNVVETDTGRVQEVRTGVVVQSVSVTVVDVKTGRLLLAGMASFKDGVPLSKAAADVGQGLTQQLR